MAKYFFFFVLKVTKFFHQIAKLGRTMPVATIGRAVLFMKTQREFWISNLKFLQNSQYRLNLADIIPIVFLTPWFSFHCLHQFQIVLQVCSGDPLDNGMSVCEKSSSGYVNRWGLPEPCSDPNCATCAVDQSTCITCKSGHFLSSSGSCVACSSRSGQCEECTEAVGTQS